MQKEFRFIFLYNEMNSMECHLFMKSERIEWNGGLEFYVNNVSYFVASL